MALDMVEPRLAKLINQYQESPKLQHVIRSALLQVQEATEAVEAIPSFFDLETAVGDQLTLIGKVMGWPRTHCVCNVQPVYGAECEGFVSAFPIAGACDANATWINCDARGFSQVTLSDDELYRKFLKVRRYQFMRQIDRHALREAAQIFWGSNAFVAHEGHGRVVLAPARELTAQELAIVQLYPRVMPVAIGTRVLFHFGTRFPLAGGGEGWGTACELVGNNIGILAENGDAILAEDGEPIGTDDVINGADVLCPVDVQPYSCA
jgi:hypothetical protein